MGQANAALICFALLSFQSVCGKRRLRESVSLAPLLDLFQFTLPQEPNGWRLCEWLKRSQEDPLRSEP